jgi:translocator protein
MNSRIKILPLIVSILLPLVIGGLSGIVTSANIPTWYASINKPWFNPPNWIFGPVWTTLYILMGIASYIIYTSEISYHRMRSLLFYTIQLCLNFAWSFIFFGLKNPGIALIEIIFMWIFIYLTILQFGKISSIASWLMVPYITWVSFASILNFYIYILN